MLLSELPAGDLLHGNIIVIHLALGRNAVGQGGAQRIHGQPHLLGSKISVIQPLLIRLRDFHFLTIDANAIFYPERSDVDTMLNQFQRLLAGCTGDELEILLSINCEIPIHTRLMDEVGEVETD